MTIIDFQPYARPPRIDALRGVALAIQLLRAAPSSPSPLVARSLASVHDRAVDVQNELKLRSRTRPENLRPLDSEFDNGWTALRDRLVCWSKVRGKSYEPLRQRAEQLLATYFADGVEFVKLSYEGQWVYSQHLLERFDEEGATADIERLAGAEFLAHVREQHAAIGAALGLTGERVERETASSTGLAERVDALAAAIGEYSRRLAGEVEISDPASVAAFRKAVAPLDAHRAAMSARARRAAATAEPEPSEPAIDPTQPIPPAPSAG